MKRSSILLLVLLTIGVSAALAQSDAAVEQEIRRLHEIQRKAFFDKDVATIDRTFSPDIIVTNPFGQFLNKQQTLDRVRNGDIDFERFDRTLDYVKVYGDTVVAAGTETMVPKGKMKGAGTIINLRMTTVWIRQHGQWLEVARHTSVLSTTPNPSANPAAK